jgi:hypothetical protein
MDESAGSVSQRVVRILALGPKDDDQLAAALKTNRVYINQVARELVRQGVVRRSTGSSGKLVNELVRGAETAGAASSYAPISPRPAREGLITEDSIKRAVANHLTAKGYRVAVMWGHDRGVDIDAVGEGGRIVVEAKGAAPAGPQQVNYFLNALGELVQRMSDEQARYGLALPSNNQFRNLVARLPALARERLRLTVYFVNAEGRVEEA